MEDINQLIEPITPSNTVNSINIYKIDYLPNVFNFSPRKIKGRKYDDKYFNVNPKIGQLKIKQFVSPILKSYWGLVSKAVKIKNTISLNTDNDKYMFVKNASKEDLKKIKYDNYFGIRVSDTDLYDFDRRMVYHDIQRDPDDNDVVIIDRNNAEPMLDLSKYKNIFIDKNTYKPISIYYIKDRYDEDTPEFIGKQQDGVTGSMILPNNDVTGSIILPDSNKQLQNKDSSLTIDEDSETQEQQSSYVNQEENLTNKEDNLTNKEDNLTNKEEERKKEIEDNIKHLKAAKIKVDKEKRKIEKDLKKTIVRYVDKYVNFAAANELNNIEDIDYIIDAFYEYAQRRKININQRSIDAVNRRVDKLRKFESDNAAWLKIPNENYWDNLNIVEH